MCIGIPMQIESVDGLRAVAREGGVVSESDLELKLPVAARSWAEPGEDNWILASEAYFVAGSSAVGGMGAPELVPFSERAAAQAFALAKGGRLLSLPEVADEDVLGPDTPLAEEGEQDRYRERLETITGEKGS